MTKEQIKKLNESWCEIEETIRSALEAKGIDDVFSHEMDKEQGDDCNAFSLSFTFNGLEFNVDIMEPQVNLHEGLNETLWRQNGATDADIQSVIDIRKMWG